MSNVSKICLILFSAVFFLICIIPSAGLTIAPDQIASDGDSLSDAPVLVDEEGSYNLSYLSDAGTYFEDHFAFRNEAISLNARVQAGLFCSSPTDQVIVGTDGWLYYGGTRADYQGDSLLSEREIENIAHNLKLLQNSAEEQGVAFIFTIAPNKNSIYPKHMPYYLPSGQNDNMERLKTKLREKEVNYVDLFSLLKESDEELYYKTDTHWSQKGTQIVANELLEHIGREAKHPEEPSSDTGVIGDLEYMLYPATTLGSEGQGEELSGEGSGASQEGDGVLVLYGDSFSNRLLPVLTPQFEEVVFSNEVPYKIQESLRLKPDAIIVELVERNIAMLGKFPPQMLSPTTEASQMNQIQSQTVLDWYQEGDYRVVEGWVDERVISDTDEILVSIKAPDQQEKTYVPFGLSKLRTDLVVTQFGYKLYLEETIMSAGMYEIKIIVKSKETNTSTIVMQHTLEYTD